MVTGVDEAQRKQFSKMVNRNTVVSVCSDLLKWTQPICQYWPTYLAVGQWSGLVRRDIVVGSDRELREGERERERERERESVCVCVCENGDLIFL